MTMRARARPLGNASCATFHVTSHATWSENSHCHDHRTRNHTPPISAIDTMLDAIISNKASRFALRRARTPSSSKTGDCKHAGRPGDPAGQDRSKTAFFRRFVSPANPSLMSSSPAFPLASTQRYPSRLSKSPLARR